MVDIVTKKRTYHKVFKGLTPEYEKQYLEMKKRARHIHANVKAGACKLPIYDEGARTADEHATQILDEVNKLRDLK